MRQQIQVLLNVVLIYDDKDKDGEDYAKDRLATVLYDLNDHTFDVRDIRETKSLLIQE